jgi:chaperonin GroEL (HSP60 family)
MVSPSRKNSISRTRKKTWVPRVLRQAAEKTGDVVGDGTSTSTILAHAILADGIRNVVACASAIDLKRGLDRGARAATAALHAMARPVKTKAERAQVATISAHNDPCIGGLVADALDKVGGEGVISVEESKTTETALDVVEGLKFDRGFLSPTSSPTQSEWSQFSRIHSFFCATTRSTPCEIWWRCSKRSRSLDGRC